MKIIRLASLLLVCILLILSAVGCDFDSSSSSSKKTVVCDECDEKNPRSAKFCQECGAALSSSKDKNDGNFFDKDSDDTWLLLESYVESTGYTLKYYYDRNGYLVGQESWSDTGELRTKTIYTNDSYGNCTLMYIPLYEQMGFDGNITFKNTYDSNGRLTRSYNEDWETYDYYYYDGDELIKIEHIDEKGNESYEEYDNGKIIRTFENGVTTDYYYNSNGKCTGTSNENLTVDEHGNITDDSFQTYEYITLKDYLAQNLHNNEYAKGNSNSGGNNNSGGNSNQGGNNNNDYDTPTVCTACRGSGQGMECVGCDGTGKALAYYDINDRPVYRTCLGCKGRGYISCAYCGGDGYR